MIGYLEGTAILSTAIKAIVRLLGIMLIGSDKHAEGLRAMKYGAWPAYYRLRRSRVIRC